MISMKMRSMAAFVILLVLTGSICAQNSSASNEETSQAAGLAQAEAAGGRRGVLLVRALRTIFVDEPSVERRIGS